MSESLRNSIASETSDSEASEGNDEVGDVDGYSYEIDKLGAPHFFYEDEEIKGDDVPYEIFKEFDIVDNRVIEPIIPVPIYLNLLPKELKTALLYYLSRFELLEVCKYKIESACTDNGFWKSKIFIDFSKDFGTEGYVGEPNVYEKNVNSITEQIGEAYGKSIYTIFSYAEAFGYEINKHTLYDFIDIASVISIPELIDSYMDSETRGYFVINHSSKSQTFRYLYNKYPEYRKYLIFARLVNNPKDLVELLQNNPDINVSVLDLAEVASSVDLPQLIKHNLDDDLTKLVDKKQ